MKERVKWIAIGFGLMVGIQVLASLMFIGFGLAPERNPSVVLSPDWVFMIFGLALGAFFIGGFIRRRADAGAGHTGIRRGPLC